MGPPRRRYDRGTTAGRYRSNQHPTRQSRLGSEPVRPQREQIAWDRAGYVDGIDLDPERLPQLPAGIPLREIRQGNRPITRRVLTDDKRRSHTASSALGSAHIAGQTTERTRIAILGYQRS